MESITNRHFRVSQPRSITAQPRISPAALIRREGLDMQIQAAVKHPAMRIGVTLIGALVLLVVLAALIRPEMIGMGMKMVHSLIVGFGL
jgi:hypothetical protein